MDKKLTLISPDAKNQISFILENGEIYYSTRRHYKANIKKSRIHLDMDEASSLGNFQLISNEESLHDEEWFPVLGQKEKINSQVTMIHHIVETAARQWFSKMKKHHNNCSNSP